MSAISWQVAGCSHGTEGARAGARGAQVWQPDPRHGAGPGTPGCPLLAKPLQPGASLGEERKEWKNHHTHCTDGKSLQPSSLPHPRGVNYTDRCTIWEVVQIFFLFFFKFFLITFFKKRDAKTTRAVPCLVLGSRCWLWERRNQHSWQAVNDPEKRGARPWHPPVVQPLSSRQGGHCQGALGGKQDMEPPESSRTKHHRGPCHGAGLGGCFPALGYKQLLGYLLNCQE